MTIQKKILFVWDFHGTLEKDNVRAVHIMVNRALEDFNIDKQISLAEAVHLYGLSWVDYFQYAYPEGNLDIWNKLKTRAINIQIEDKIVEQFIKPADYAAEVLAEIQKSGNSNILLSNTVPEWVERFAIMVHLEEYFDAFIGLDVHNEARKGKNISHIKTNALEKYIAEQNFSKVIKIGDRESDIEAGRAVGAITYFIRNEYNKAQKINISPDYEISDLRQILSEISKN